MSASAWAPGSTINAKGSVKFQIFTSTGDTDFELTEFLYAVDTSSLHVYISGAFQRPGVDFIETAANSFSLVEAPPVGAIVVAVAYTEVTAELNKTLVVKESAIMTAGQTVVNFDAIQYLKGGNHLKVFVDGLLKDVSTDYTETGTNVIVFSTSFVGGEKLVGIVNLFDTTTDIDTLRGDLLSSGVGTGSDLIGFEIDKTVYDVLNTNNYTSSIAALRLYTGNSTKLAVMSGNQSGIFQLDPTDTSSVDNSGTIIVDGLNRRWKRIHSGIVELTWFGAVCNGVADDTAAVLNAVAFCYANNYTLLWEGTSLTTSTIPHLHNINHLGKGSIKRGTNLFYPGCPAGITNTLYVATTGNDTNDGLSSSQPFVTTQAAGNSVYNYVYANVTWKIQHAAGTYTQSTAFSRAFPSPNRVQFLGAAVATGVVPTTIFASPGGSGKFGLWCSNGASFYVEDIKFNSYRSGASPSVSGTSSGVVSDGGCDLYTVNVHAYDCDVGIETTAQGRVRVTGGVVNACAYGIKCLSNITYTIGYNATAPDLTGATGTAITNCTVAGILAQECATGHCDYGYLKGNAIGISVQSRSRCHLLGSILENSATGIDVNGNSTWYNNPTNPNTFTDNTTPINHTGGSVEENLESNSHVVSSYVVRDTTTYATQSTSPVAAITYTIPAQYLKARAAGFDLDMFGNAVGVLGTKTVTVSIGGTTLLSKAILAATTAWRAKIKFVQRTNATQQKCLVEFIENGVVTALTVTTTIAEDFTTDKTLTISHQVANAADTSRIQHADLELIYG